MAKKLGKHYGIFDRLGKFKKNFIIPKNMNTNALQLWVVVVHYKFCVGCLLLLFTGRFLVQLRMINV